jgi:coatomer subunit beta
MSSSDTPCYTIVFESAAEYPSVSDLRSALEKGTDDVKIDTLRKIIVSTINGNPQASFYLLFTIFGLVLTHVLASINDADHSVCNAFTQ